MEHHTVYREKGRYAGWPANYGIWSWGDEIVVGFVAGYPLSDSSFHARDKSRPFTTMQARSHDGGVSWMSSPMPVDTPGNRALSADEHVVNALNLATALKQNLGPVPSPVPTSVDFSHPDFAMLCARTGLRAGTRAWFYTSYDRCYTWDGPYALPMFEQVGVEARTDVMITGKYSCVLLLSASGASDREGKGVFCVSSTDDGQSFRFLSWVTRVSEGYAIMPSTVKLTEDRWLSTIRCLVNRGTDQQKGFIDAFISQDQGKTWSYLNRPVPNTGPNGNPPSLLRLHDGRLCLTYGYRNPPYGIRAVLSEDGGMTWTPPIVLRDDGGSGDLGYPRTVQRSDGSVVAVYYFNDEPGGAAYIACTIWQP